MNGIDDIRAALTNNKLLLIYVPENTKIKLKLETTASDKNSIICVETRELQVWTVSSCQGGCMVGMHIFEHDALYVVDLK